MMETLTNILAGALTLMIVVSVMIGYLILYGLMISIPLLVVASVLKALGAL